MSNRAGGDANLPERWTPDKPFLTPGAWHMQFRDERPPRDPFLDYPSEPHPLLDTLMNDALVRLHMVANGPIAAWDAVRVSGGTRESDSPGTYNGADVDRLSIRYYRARTHRTRLLIIGAAQTKARQATHSPNAMPARGSEEWKARIARDDRPRRVVAAEYGVSPKTITAARKAYR